MVKIIFLVQLGQPQRARLQIIVKNVECRYRRVFPKSVPCYKKFRSNSCLAKKHQNSLLLQVDIHIKSDLMCENVYLFTSIQAVLSSCTISKIVYIFNTLLGKIY